MIRTDTIIQKVRNHLIINIERTGLHFINKAPLSPIELKRNGNNSKGGSLSQRTPYANSLQTITNNLKQICKMNKRMIQITDAKVR